MVNFQNYENDFDTSASEHTRGLALLLRCWWMKVRDIPAGLRQSTTSLVHKLWTDMLFLAQLTLEF